MNKTIHELVQQMQQMLEIKGSITGGYMSVTDFFNRQSPLNTNNKCIAAEKGNDGNCQNYIVCDNTKNGSYCMNFTSCANSTNGWVEGCGMPIKKITY